MSVRCDLGVETSPEELCRNFSVHTPENALVDQQKRYQRGSSESLPPGRCSSTKPCLQSFLHCAPVRCIETITRFLDFSSFVVLLSLNSCLLELCDSPALQSCWTHFALLQRILRHGENVLLPRLSPTSLPLLHGSGSGCGFRSGGGKGGRRSLQNEDEEKVSPCQTFSPLLPRVTRQELVRIGSLNSNWRSKSFATEQRQVICSGEALDKAYVLPTPPLQSSFSDYSVAPDAQLNLQACPSVGLPACLQPAGAGDFMNETSIFTVLPNSRVFAVHVGASTPRGQSVEVKLPLLPAKISVDPDPLIKFGGYAPKGWLLGEDDASFPAAPAAAAGGAASSTRISQSQRKRQQRQQRRQQLHRLHMSWVHLAPHPIRPCPDARNPRPKRSFREGSPLLFSNSQPFKFSSKSCGHAAEPDEGLGHCPLVRLLCLCLPTIEVEKTQAADRHGSGAETHGESKEIETHAEAGQQQHCQRSANDQGANSSGSSQSAAASVPMLAGGAASLGAVGARLCASDGEAVYSTSAAPAAALTPEPSVLPSAAGRVWPVALCSYSPKRSRFLAHAVVCCALREGETVQAARGRLWFKAKRQTNAERPSRGTPSIDEEPQGAAAPVCAAAANGRKQQSTEKEPPGSRSNSNKVISFCLQQHPSAVFVGMVAIGTSDGRILCTPPPLCLVRRCCCGGNCLEALKEKAARGCFEAAAGCRDAMELGSRLNGAHQAKELAEPLAIHHRLPHFLQTKTGAAAPPLSSSSNSSRNSYDPAVTAAQAGRGVAFAEVGNFGEARGAVDYVELVRGTPWAVRMQRQDQPQLLIPTQQRDFSWHWTRAPCLEKSQTPGGVPVESMAPEGVSPCGGFLAEALWLFACSKEAGLKIFRFMWSPVDGGSGIEASPGLQTTCGQWKCVFTVRGNCDLVSLDINNGIIAICTPTDSRVHFLCFRHLLPAHIYFSNAREAPVISAESLSYLSRCGLPRPQRVPLDGYLATQQQQFSPLLQSPAECARLELLVARRPSFLQPLGGRRWVVIDGAVIRVVQIKVKEAAPQQKPLPDSLQQELMMHFTLTGTPMEQLRQLCRPVAVEPLLPWVVNHQPAPELQTVRLCVFSHPRTIYKCAFDGVRRLLTVDLQEVLMVWDLQRYTKLCGIDLMASAESHSFSQEADGCGGDGRNICLSSDGLCSENDDEALRRRHSMGVKTNNAKALRKAGKLSLKKQFGSGWMQKQVLAHRSNTEQQQCRRSLHATGHSSRSAGCRLSVDSADRVSVGGVWFDSSSLEPALQLQFLYDMQKEKANVSSLATHPKANAEEQLDSSCNRKDVEARVPTKSELTSGSSGDPFLPGVAAAITRSCELPKAEKGANEFHSLGKNEAADSELLTPTAVCYADDFPPLSAQPARLQLKGHAFLKEMGAASTMQLSAAALSPTAPEASARSDNMLLDENLPPGSSASSPPLHGDRWILSGDSYIDEKSQQQPSQLDAAGHTTADSGGRLSFAAVVAAAAASSSSSCQQTGWSSGPTDPSLMAGLLGKEKCRALQEAAAALGVTAEELYLEQVAQWEQLQRMCHQRTQTQENSGGQLTGECEFDNPSGRDATAEDTIRELPQQSSPVCQDIADGLQQAEQANISVVACRIVPAEEGSTSRGCKASGSPSAQALIGSPQCSSPQESAWMQRESPRLHPLPAPMDHSSGLPAESPMVGLLGRQRCVARRGPNAQQRHITAVCLSETCMGLLFKNLKTWQIWTFAPAARASLPSGAAADAFAQWML